jgi:endo-1,4-beta-xylanase
LSLTHYNSKSKFKSNMFKTLQNSKQVAILLAMVFCISISNSFAQMAVGKPKFLGNVVASSVPSNYDTYWNQITPENSTKWGSVEGTRNTMNWTQADLAYNHAKTKGYQFKFHTLVWGSQYPSWITSLNATDQKNEIIQYMQLAAARYPNIDIIDVVNEPIKTPCPFKGALGGDGATGWDWVIESFRLARIYFPNAKLCINEYGTENDVAARNTYKTIINLLKTRGYIDGIGVQAHQFNVDNMSAAQMTTALNDYASTGVDVYISELDITGGGNETTQKAKYQELFPVMYEHASVKGVTLWGYVEGSTWKANTGILNSNGTERQAMVWLKSYMANFGVTPSLTLSSSAVSLAATASTSAAITVTSNQSWTVSSNQTWLTTSTTSGSNNGSFTISATANTISTARSGTITVTGGGLTQTIAVTQAAATVSPTLSATPGTISLVATASSSPITVTSNQAWTATSNQTWLTLSVASGSNNGSVTASATANTATTSRSATVTFTGGGLTSTVTVSQAGTASGTSRTISVRARTTQAGGQLQLKINGTLVTTFNLTTSLAIYTATSSIAGTVRVEFANDATGRDLQVDYLKVNNTTYQAEAQAINTAYYANGRCGGGANSELMHCNGYIEFAGSSSAARESNVAISTIDKELAPINIYPNPTPDGQFLISLRSASSKVSIYDITGKMLKTFYNNGQLEMAAPSGFNSGIYILEVVDEYGKESKKFIVE